ncbi:MAG TPA: discoidin domain-containing protein [Streptosporangiaceae bacterium]|jgi:hypothetical protein
MPAGRTDPKLKHFSVAHDTAYIIPVLQVPNSAGDYARSYDLEVSRNGRSWTTVADCTGTGDPETVSFPAQTACYIRVTDTLLFDGMTTSTGNWWSIDELNLYSASNARAAVK